MLHALLFFSFFISLNFSQLLYVEELFRHGARYTVLELYDRNDSSLDEGELTGVGMRQHYNLGRYLREEYVDKLKFMNSSFDHQ